MGVSLGCSCDQHRGTAANTITIIKPHLLFIFLYPCLVSNLPSRAGRSPLYRREKLITIRSSLCRGCPLTNDGWYSHCRTASTADVHQYRITRNSLHLLHFPGFVDVRVQHDLT